MRPGRLARVLAPAVAPNVGPEETLRAVGLAKAGRPPTPVPVPETVPHVEAGVEGTPLLEMVGGAAAQDLLARALPEDAGLPDVPVAAPVLVQAVDDARPVDGATLPEEVGQVAVPGLARGPRPPFVAQAGVVDVTPVTLGLLLVVLQGQGTPHPAPIGLARARDGLAPAQVLRAETVANGVPLVLEDVLLLAPAVLAPASTIRPRAVAARLAAVGRAPLDAVRPSGVPARPVPVLVDAHHGLGRVQAAAPRAANAGPEARLLVHGVPVGLVGTARREGGVANAKDS